MFTFYTAAGENEPHLLFFTRYVESLTCPHTHMRTHTHTTHIGLDIQTDRQDRQTDGRTGQTHTHTKRWTDEQEDNIPTYIIIISYNHALRRHIGLISKHEQCWWFGGLRGWGGW